MAVIGAKIWVKITTKTKVTLRREVGKIRGTGKKYFEKINQCIKINVTKKFIARAKEKGRIGINNI